MLTAFVYNEVAVLVRHWFEIDLDDSHLEHGSRIELRLLEPQPHRGTESAAQRIVADRPLWRADLFDLIGGAPSGFEAAHFHPYFDGVEPSRRHWADEVKAAPWDWLHGRLRDVAAVASEAGVPLADPAGESERVRADVDTIVASARDRAGDRCRTKDRCHAWTSDVEPAVHRMLDTLARPDLLDRDRVSPWLRRHPAAG
ncbi:MAG: hypothetical protein J2P19_14710 [Pseudonocardia sp.]|nr:hypothetical protein [Pseudonocardia sp.]